MASGTKYLPAPILDRAPGDSRERQPPSRAPQASPLRRVMVRVPEDYAEDLRRLARELRTRQPGGPPNASPKWRRLSPSAELLRKQREDS